MQSSGMPAEYANMLSSMDTRIAKGSEERLNDVVLELTGKPPRKFQDFAEANKSCWT
jgi:festuclavine dehydrogenase